MLESTASFDELLARTDAPPGSTWGLWGPDDRLGCLNRITTEARRRGAGEVREGRLFSLNLDLAAPDPPLFGREAFHHEVVWLSNGRGHDERLSNWNPQGSTQWDGFRHMRSASDGFYNGGPDEDLGIEHWARTGIATRGVLVDIERWRRANGTPLSHTESSIIEPEELRACLDHQGTRLETGDVLVVRTGWMTWYRELDRDAREVLARKATAAGLRSGRATARWLWDSGLAAVAADNPAVEASPTYDLLTVEQARQLADQPAASHELILHMALLPMLGMPLGELWNLDELATDCATDGRYTFLLTSAPLPLRHGVGSPANALALK